MMAKSLVEGDPRGVRGLKKSSLIVSVDYWLGTLSGSIVPVS